MKKIIEKFKNLSTVNKAIIAGSLLIIVGVVLIISIGGTAASSETVDIPNKIVDGISFENATIDQDNGISTFEADVYNENKELYQLNYVTVTFTYENGDTINLKGYIGNTLSPDAGQKLIISTDEDLTNVVDLEYTIIKPET